MLDLLLIPAALVLVLGLRAVRRGEHRLHGHLMAAAITVTGLRVLLYPRGFAPLHPALWLTTLGLAGTTLLLGRMALAWRESRSHHSAIPRLHRAFGAATLIGLAFTTLAWLLRTRA